MSAAVRFYELDLLRFVSAVLVVFFHYTFTAYMEGFAPVADFPAIRELSRYAYVGINFFFIISGFVIFMSIESGSIKLFVASRFSRLFPAFWLGLLLTTAITLLIGGAVFQADAWQFLANITMASQLFSVKPMDSAYWTLYIELKFYLLVAIALLCGALKYSVFLIAAILTGSFIALFLQWASQIDMFVAMFPHWSGYFAAGALFYLIRRDGLNNVKFVLLLLSYAFVLKQSVLFAGLMEGWFKVEFDGWVIALINSLFFGLMCITACKDKYILRQRPFYVLGGLTYPLYLLHQHIGYMLFNRFGDSETIAILAAATFCMMLVLAYLIWRYFEQSMQPLFKRFVIEVINRRTFNKFKTNSV